MGDTKRKVKETLNISETKKQIRSKRKGKQKQKDRDFKKPHPSGCNGNKVF